MTRHSLHNAGAAMHCPGCGAQVAPGNSHACPTSSLKAGTRVIVEGETTWSLGRIEEIVGRRALPPLPGAPDVSQVRNILEEWKASRIAVISHAGMIFAAFETPEGWKDLRGQKLTITPET